MLGDSRLFSNLYLQLCWKNKMKTPIRELSLHCIGRRSVAARVSALHALHAMFILQGSGGRHTVRPNCRLRPRLGPFSFAGTHFQTIVEVFEAAAPPGQRAAVLQELSGGEHTRIKVGELRTHIQVECMANTMNAWAASHGLVSAVEAARQASMASSSAQHVCTHLQAQVDALSPPPPAAGPASPQPGSARGGLGGWG